jgi:uncharacterized protein involved in exopolysaccharide biosynthesis
MAGEARRDRSGLLAAWRGVVRRRWRLGLLGFMGVFALAAAVLFLSRPVYRADARLRLGEPPPMSGVSPTSGFFGLLRLGGDPFANDLELIGSRTLNEQVVERVALNATVSAPRGWHRDSLFTRFETTRSTERAAFRIAWREDGRIEVRQTSPRDSAIGAVAAGEPFAFGGLTAVFRPLRPRMPDEVTVTTQPFDDAARLLVERLQVERARREANVVDLAFDSPDPDVAVGAVRTAVNGFIALRTAIQKRESGETVDSLRTVAAATLAELRAAEAALAAAQRTSRLYAPEAQAEVFAEQYALTVADLERARMERAAIDSVLARASVVESASGWTTLLAYPRFLENENVGGLLTQITTLEQQRREMATRRAAGSREYGVLVDQIGYLDGTLRTLAAGYRSSLVEQTAGLEAQVGRMDREMAAVPDYAIELGRRQRAVRLLSEVVVLTEQRLRQEELRQALTFANVQVIDPPALRRKPVWPRKKLGLAVGLLIAGMSGALGMAAAEAADRTVRRASQAGDAAGAPVLAAARFAGEDVQLGADGAAAVAGKAGARFAVAAVGAPAPAAAVARLLSAGPSGTVRSAWAGRDGQVPPDVVLCPPIDRFGAAAAAAEVGPVVLVATVGHTTVDAVARARELLDEAGARIAGVVLAVDRREPPELWT